MVRQIKFPDDYDKKKVDGRAKLRTQVIANAPQASDVRAGIAQGIEIADVTANEANDRSNNVERIAQDLNKRWDEQIEGQDYDNESKDARYSEADDKTYSNLNERLKVMDKKPQQAVDALETGSENLLRNSNVQYINNNYQIAKYNMSEKMVSGQAYTALIKGKLADGKDSFALYLNGGENNLAGLADLGNGYYRATFIGKSDTEVNDYIAVFTMPQNVDEESTIEWMSLKKGAKNIDWSPAPIDNERHPALGMGTKFYAHRGAQSIAPENSLPAVRKATNHNGVEIDIHVTSDGQWVVMHDGTVDRMTNGTGAISSFTFNDLRKLRIDTGAKVDRYSDEDLIIPTLQEVLTICRDKDLQPVIEIKTDPTDNYNARNYDSLADIIHQFDLEYHAILISFNKESLQQMKMRLPNIEISWLVSNINEGSLRQAVELGSNAGLDIEQGSDTLTAVNLQEAHSRGLKIGVWTTVDDSRREFLESVGIDYITTNSLSGKRRYTPLNPLQDWGHPDVAIKESFVQEIGDGRCQINFNISGGKTNAPNTIIFTLPKWAIPESETWMPCICRATDGVVLGSFNVLHSGTLTIGLDWSKGTGSWVAGSGEYKL